MALGLTLDEIYHHTLSDLSMYDDASVIKDEVKDMWCWFMGKYVYEALGAALGAAFATKGQEPPKYLENPILKMSKDANRELTEEEKQQQISVLFSNLEIMKTNFELTHGEKPCQI